jgi:hypothetical protein
MLVEAFHWPPNDLAQADIDMVLPLAVYYPHWKKAGQEREDVNEVYADQAEWL